MQSKLKKWFGTYTVEEIDHEKVHEIFSSSNNALIIVRYQIPMQCVKSIKKEMQLFN